MIRRYSAHRKMSDPYLASYVIKVYFATTLFLFKRYVVGIYNKRNLAEATAGLSYPLYK